LRLTGFDGNESNAVSFLYGNTINAGRGSVEEHIEQDMALVFNGNVVTDLDGKPCSLAIDVKGDEEHFFGNYYWFFYAGGALLFAAYLLSVYLRYQKGKTPYVVGVVKSLHKYGFLIRQLVSRDFKTKYKRSVLGILWSFLNPLLTMSVQYVVFSYLFKSDIENFVVYLLTGIVCYNFFHEATNMCLMSIIGNAPLISKVYVPKYIYPFSRSLSSCINLLFSLIPLLICLFITRTPITPALLLLPFGLIMLFLLAYGVGLILATMMVFFRDTQFLWNIMTMLLMYLTPIFYPESIIPEQFMTVYKLNPLYHVLRFMRSILLDGVSLEPKAYLICAALCVVPFLLGVLIFRKNEDKFILHI
jgi:ABC-2 type transport system permease protein